VPPEPHPPMLRPRAAHPTSSSSSSSSCLPEPDTPFDHYPSRSQADFGFPSSSPSTLMSDANHAEHGVDGDRGSKGYRDEKKGVGATSGLAWRRGEKVPGLSLVGLGLGLPGKGKGKAGLRLGE